MSSQVSFMYRVRFQPFEVKLSVPIKWYKYLINVKICVLDKNTTKIDNPTVELINYEFKKEL